MIFKVANQARRLLPAAQAARLDAFLDRQSDLQKSAGRTALSAFTLRVLGAAIAYLSQILLARWMGIFDYGIFVVVYVWITILGQIGNLGFSSSVIRFIPQYRAQGDQASLRGVLGASRGVAMLSATVLAATGSALVWFVPGVVASHYVVPILLGAICLPMFCLTEVQDGIARAFDWPDLAFGPTYIWRPLAVLAVMVAAHELELPMTAATAVISTIIGTWLTAMVQLYLIHRRVRGPVAPGPRRLDLRTWIVVSLPILLSDGFYALLTSVDVVMVAHFGTPDDVAIYYAATKTLALVHFVYYAVRAAAGPRYAYLYHAGDSEGLREMVRTSIRWTFWPSVLVSIVVLLAGELLLSLFGSAFTDGRLVLLILVFGILTRASVGPVETLLTMAGQQTACAAIFGVALLANVGLNILLIPSYGIYGAALATAIAMVLETLLVIGAIRHHFGFAVWIFRLDRPDRAPRGGSSPLQPKGDDNHSERVAV